ncbi:5-methylcytosine-specific restriction enzyme subunit McrC [Arenibacter algicola]|uniref:5-methylcytosine-specific restriction enzyme subunit McrC n=1 Tax=Arenibacter algicola TaxID=616991 RepID=A0ABY3AI25_9FLAO
MSSPLRFFEYDKVAYKGKWQRTLFKKTHYEAFENYYNANPETPFFELIPYGVRFKQYVGAIQIGRTTIEVLPKVGKQGNEDTWQSVLLDMLKTCNLLIAKQTGEAQLKLRANSVLELYFELFINEIDSLCRRGLIKKYQPQSGQNKTLKGAIHFSKNISKNTVHKERFYINYTTYTKDHLLHQILFETLKVIDLVSNSPLLKDKIGRLKIMFPEVKTLEVSESHFSKITESRKHVPYEKAVAIAKLILLNYRPDIKAGHKDLLAIMFDMNVLWEEYVFRILKKKQSKEFQVLGQGKKLFWGRSQKIQPDIVLIHKATNQTFIIDTKWKVLNKNRPGDDDLKQMYVYNHYWESYHSMLLYPQSNDQQDLLGSFALPIGDKVHQCQLSFAKVLKNGGLNNDISQDIIDKLQKL